MRKVEHWRRIIAACAILTAPAGWTQTRVDLRNQGKEIDFTQAPSTKPVKTGIVLPATCATGELFLLTGLNIENLYACAAANSWVAQSYLLPSQAGASGKVLSSNGSGEQWSGMGDDVTGPVTALTVSGLRNRPVSATEPAGGQTLMWNGNSWVPQTITVGQGSLTIESNGTVIGTRSAENFINGLGLITAISDDGAKLTLQQSVDTAVLETKAGEQAGTALYCASASASASAYACALNPALTAYTTGMSLRWKPDIDAAGGAVTLDVDTLGAKALKLADGVTSPEPGDILAGRLYSLWFDGVNFRLGNPDGAVSSGEARPPCGANLRGRIWLLRGAAGLADEVAVCAKDAADSYDWRVLY